MKKLLFLTLLLISHGLFGMNQSKEEIEVRYTDNGTITRYHTIDPYGDEGTNYTFSGFKYHDNSSENFSYFRREVLYNQDANDSKKYYSKEKFYFSEDDLSSLKKQSTIYVRPVRFIPAVVQTYLPGKIYKFTKDPKTHTTIRVGNHTIKTTHAAVDFLTGTKVLCKTNGQIRRFATESGPLITTASLVEKWRKRYNTLEAIFNNATTITD